MAPSAAAANCDAVGRGFRTVDHLFLLRFNLKIEFPQCMFMTQKFQIGLIFFTKAAMNWSLTSEELIKVVEFEVFKLHLLAFR